MSVLPIFYGPFLKFGSKFVLNFRCRFFLSLFFCLKYLSAQRKPELFVCLRHSGDRGSLQDGVASGPTLRTHKLLSHHRPRWFHRLQRQSDQRSLRENTPTQAEHSEEFKIFNVIFMFCSAAILRPPHPHRRGDHRFRSDPRRHRPSIEAAPVHHYRGGGAGRF